MWLYTRSLAREFRGTIALAALLVGVGAVAYHLADPAALEGTSPGWGLAVYTAWMALVGEPVFARPDHWYLQFMNSAYPLFGVALIGEGIVRFALLMVSRRQGEKEWMRVMASTYRNHVVLCGLGHLGYRVLENLVEMQRPVVVLEKKEESRFVALAKAAGVPVLVRDMKDDAALVAAGVEHAEAIILASDDDLANVEVAMDARRLNPGIRIAVRLFDQQMAAKLKEAVAFDTPFSSSALAAPAVAAMTLGAKVVAAFSVAGVPHVAVELAVERRSPLVGSTVGGLESERGVRVLARHPRKGGDEVPPRAGSVIDDDDRLTVHVPVARLAELSAAFRWSEASTPDRS
jgi:voltage-gated potassium channel